jgi:nucleotide-binding universal stress UspA family protein
MCAHAEIDAYVVKGHFDGSVESRPIDPELASWESAVFDSNLADPIHRLAGEEAVAVEFGELAGNIGHALARLADVLDAELIVVGSRRGGGARVCMHEFFSGSWLCIWLTGSLGPWSSSRSRPSLKAGFVGTPMTHVSR